MRLTKKQSEHIHAKKRIQERYGLSLNRHQLRELESLIQCGKGRFIEKQSNRVTVWEVSYQDCHMRLVYDTMRHSLITALPKE